MEYLEQIQLVVRARLELGISRFQFQHPDHSATLPPYQMLSDACRASLTLVVCLNPSEVIMAHRFLIPANNWAYNIDGGNTVVFLNLKKVFDKVINLLSKLSFDGINGNSRNWFKSYLDNRQ